MVMLVPPNRCFASQFAILGDIPYPGTGHKERPPSKNITGSPARLAHILNLSGDRIEVVRLSQNQQDFLAWLHYTSCKAPGGSGSGRRHGETVNGPRAQSSGGLRVPQLRQERL